MKKLLALVIGLLSATPLHATTFTTNITTFPGSPPHFYTGNGMKISFGDSWVCAADSDLVPQPPPNLALTGGIYGNIANEGPTNIALVHSPCEVGYCGPVEHTVWLFDPPINELKFSYTGSLYQAWTDEFGYHITLGSLPIHVYILQNDTFPYGVMDEIVPTGFSGRTPIDYGSGYSEGSPCSGDPTGIFCNWDEFQYYSAAPFKGVYISTDGYWSCDDEMGCLTAMWIRSITVSTTECQNPPCEFEQVTETEAPTPAKKTSWGKLKTIYRPSNP